VLRESHLLPAALYRLSRDPSRANPNPVLMAAGGASATSRQAASRFLCDDCEQRFSERGERYVLGQCARPGDEFRLRELLERQTPIAPEQGFRLYEVGELLGAHASASSLLRSSHIVTDPGVSETRRALARVFGYQSLAVVPLFCHGEALGTISLTRREPGGFTNDEVVLLQTFADQAVIAIENIRLFNELKARTDDLCMGRTRAVPGGSGGGIPGNGGCTGLAFWRFFSGRGLAIQHQGSLAQSLCSRPIRPGLFDVLIRRRGGAYW